MVASTYWTADMVRALPDDGQRYETVYGVLLVSPSPRRVHQRVVRRLLTALDAYLAADPIGEVLPAPADIEQGPDVLVQPDVFVTDRTKGSTDSWPLLEELLLVIEVLSPSSGQADRVIKRRLYQRHVATYWMVDVGARTADVWTRGVDFPHVENAVLRWQPGAATAPLEIRLDDLFAD